MSEPTLYDFEPTLTDDLQEIVAGLKQTPKYLSFRFSYDERGAKLYEDLCQTTEYYLTRTEQTIMHQYMEQIAGCFADPIVIIEYGSGSTEKTRFLFDHLPDVVGYIPIDISRQQLIENSTNIAATYPHIEVLPVCADYTRPFELPLPADPSAGA